MKKLLAGMLFCAGAAWAAPVHLIADLSHAFSFYADGRFHKQYLPDSPVNTNWGVLEKVDFSNANLILLPDCDPHLAYTPEDFKALDGFLAEGGSLVIFGTPGDSPQQALIRRYGASFTGAAQGALTVAGAVDAVEGAGFTLIFETPEAWRKLIVDEAGNAAAAWRRVDEKGYVLVVSRGLAGVLGDGSDPLNQAWWKRVLPQIAAAKRVDPAQPFTARTRSQSDYSVECGMVSIGCCGYLEPVAKAIQALAEEIKPAAEKILGVPVALKTPLKVTFLPSADAEFHAIRQFGIPAFYDGFPEKKAGMTRRLTVLWLRAFFEEDAEPWSDAVASYVTAYVLDEAGLPAGKALIAERIERARRLDPKMELYTLDGACPPEKAPALTPAERDDLRTGKVFFILEEMRKRNPDAVAVYLREKTAFAQANPQHRPYTVSDTAVFLSRALGENLFPFFNAHGIPVSEADAQVKLP